MAYKRNRGGWEPTRNQKARRGRGPRTQVMRALKGLAESKRENMHVHQDVYAHDAGNTLAGVGYVGGYGRPNDKKGYNWLGLQVGDTKAKRDGDSVFSQYVDYKLQLNGYSNFPSQMCRIIIFSPKTIGVGGFNNLYGTSNISSLFVTDGTTTGSGNLLIQPVDTFKFKVHRDFVVAPLKNQLQGDTPNGSGLLYDVLKPSTATFPFSTEPGYYRKLYSEYAILLGWFQWASQEHPEDSALAALALEYQLRYPNFNAEYLDAVDRYDDLVLIPPPDDAGNDVNYPIVSGRLKINRKIQYQTGTEVPIKGTDLIQIAIIPYADTNCATTSNIMQASYEITHYFKDF